MKVFVVQAEHFNVPGIITHVHVSYDGAFDDAAELTATIASDSPYIGAECDGMTWQVVIEKLQDAHGAAHCYVEIIETELIGFQP